MTLNAKSLSAASVAFVALALVGCASDEPGAVLDMSVSLDMTQVTDMGVVVDMPVVDVPVVDMPVAEDMAVVDMMVAVDLGVVDAGEPMCGNSVIEGAEECDDGDTEAGDGCDGECQSEAVRTAFRLVSLDILDPHAYTNVGVCFDGTSLLNGQLSDAITMDDDSDGVYDLNIALSFLPLNPEASENNVQVSFPDCHTATGNCDETASDPTPKAGISANMSTGTCLSPIEGTTRASYGTIETPEGPCFSANFGTTTFDINGITLTLRETAFAAEYSGEPVSGLVTGLVMGFLTEADADATTIPDDITFVGGMQLSSLLPGGTSCCRTPMDDDRDTFTDGTTRGWYFYMAFTAEPVPVYTAL